MLYIFIGAIVMFVIVGAWQLTGDNKARCGECGNLIGGPVGDRCRCGYDTVSTILEALESPSYLFSWVPEWVLILLFVIGVIAFFAIGG